MEHKIYEICLNWLLEEDSDFSKYFKAAVESTCYHVSDCDQESLDARFWTLFVSSVKSNFDRSYDGATACQIELLSYISDSLNWRQLAEVYINQILKPSSIKSLVDQFAEDL